MSSDLPYLIAPKRFPELLGKIQAAAVPERVTFEFIKKLGFSSSNDRAFPSLLRRLGFIDGNGVPTDRYRAYRQKPHAKRVLAEGIREAYAELFALHTDANAEDRESLKGLVSRVTGREQRFVDLISATFDMLCKNADFSVEPEVKKVTPVKVDAEDKKDEKPKAEGKKDDKSSAPKERGLGSVTFAYNIQVHLPATSDIAVYNAIFKSLRDNLGE